MFFITSFAYGVGVLGGMICGRLAYSHTAMICVRQSMKIKINKYLFRLWWCPLAVQGRAFGAKTLQ